MFFLSFQVKKVKFTILQEVIEIVFFFTFNHSNTLKENAIHNINILIGLKPHKVNLIIIFQSRTYENRP